MSPYQFCSARRRVALPPQHHPCSKLLHLGAQQRPSKTPYSSCTMMFVQSEQQNPAELSKPVQPAVYPAGKGCMQLIDSNFLIEPAQF